MNPQTKNSPLKKLALITAGIIVIIILLRLLCIGPFCPAGNSKKGTGNAEQVSQNTAQGAQSGEVLGAQSTAQTAEIAKNVFINELNSILPNCADGYVLTSSNGTFACVEDKDTDTDTDNQTLALQGTTLGIANGNAVNLGAFLDNTDNQTLAWDNATNTLSISGGNSVDLSDLSQTLSLTNNVLTISDSASSVDLSAYLDNTDNQTLSLSNNNLSISGGNSVDLSAYLDNTDNQTLTLTGTTLAISNGNSVDFTNWDTDATDDVKTLNDLTDVDTATTAPNNGALLSFNGTNWAPVNPTTYTANLYTSDGTLTANRTVNMANNTLTFENGNIGVGVPARTTGTGWVSAERFNGSYLTGHGYDVAKLIGTGTRRINFLGYVGIGTDNPTERLDINANMRLRGAFYDGNNNAGTAGQVLFSTGSTVEWRDSTEIGYWVRNSQTLTLRYPGDAIIAEGTLGSGDDLATSGAGTKMFWYPKKGAFRAGTTHRDYWDDRKIGENSVAFGYDTVASGARGFAYGYGTSAPGTNTLAGGQYSHAHGINSSAIGYRSRSMGGVSTARGRYSQSFGDASVAMGDTVTVYGDKAVGFGDHVTVNGDYSAGFGEYNNIDGADSVAFGASNAVSGNYAGAFGFFNSASGSGSFVTGAMNTVSDTGDVAFGLFNNVTGYVSFAQGTNNSVEADLSAVFGEYNTANGNHVYAFGNDNAVNGAYAFAMGESNNALGDYSLAFGKEASALGNYSLAYGNQVTAEGNYSVAGGIQSNAQGKGSVALGAYNVATSDVSIALGINNAATSRYSAAMGIGNTANNEASFAVGGYNTANADYSAALGFYNQTNAPYSATIGYHLQTNADHAVALGGYTQANGQFSLAMGYYAQTNAKYSASLGLGTISTVDGSMVLGAFNRPFGTTGGLHPNDPLLVVGNGYDNAHRRNAFTILKNGNVGVGVDQPVFDFQVGSIVNPKTAAANAWVTYSDARLKTNVVELNNALDKVTALRGVSFNWTATGAHSIGFIAQEVQQVVPEVVFQGADGYFSVDYSKLTPLLVEAVKEQQNQLEEQEQVLHAQEEQLEEHSEKLHEVRETVYGTATADQDHNPDNEQVWGLTQVFRVLQTRFEVLKQATFRATATFTQYVHFLGTIVTERPIYYKDKDVAGYAIIKAGDTQVRITFHRAYPNTPIINVTAMDKYSKYYVTDVSKNGFTIKLRRAGNQDAKFSWQATYVKDAVTFSSQGSSTPAPTSTPTPTPTSTPTPTPTNTPTPTSTPTPTPTNTPTPTSTPTPSPTPTNTPTNTPTP